MRTNLKVYVLMIALNILVSTVALFAQTPAYLWTEAYDSNSALAVRISPPSGYVRNEARPGSFAEWLRHLPLKPGAPAVLLFNGDKKRNQNAHYAVIDIDVGHKNLQQCADAVIRLRAEYLYQRHDLASLHFNFTSGDRADFTSWAVGQRPQVRGEKVRWIRSQEPDSSYANFRKYLNTVFTYAGSYSLSKELKSVENISDMKIGDVFIQGGFPGHAVIVIDLAVNTHTDGKVFMIAQSYMPAQEPHILINPHDSTLSPWYDLDFGDTLYTPEWTFRVSDLKSF